MRALLVDDERSSRLFVQNLLQKQGVEVDVAESWEQPLRKLQRNDYHCVLMDAQMPVMDGVEATKSI